ncbi:GNAT family N-acetyltransferase [Dictyobacter halimunensis]
MSFLLDPGSYARVRPLFEDATYHLVVMNVLTGVLPGKIYVDDPDNPGTSILLPSNRHRVYVGGAPEPAVLEDVLERNYKRSHEGGYGLLIYYPSDTWRQALEQLLPQQKAFAGQRQFYRLREPSTSWNWSLPENIIAGRIEEAIVEDESLVNRDLLREEICSESPSLEYFFRRNFGFCARDGQQLVAWCLAEYHYQSRYELGIETIEAYQRKGIATYLAAAVIRKAFAEGATEIGWHCWAGNEPSIATAVKLGFEKARDYAAYLC